MVASPEAGHEFDRTTGPDAGSSAAGVFKKIVSALLLLVALPILLGVQRPPGLSDVDDVRTWSYADYTRVVIEVSGDVSLPEIGLVRLPANIQAGRPERLYLDIPDLWVGRRYESGIEVGDGLLKAVRLGQNTLRTTRLVLDLERYDHHRLFVLPSPARIVVDVYGERGAKSRIADEESGRLPAGLRRVHTVVVDAGHGGRDPGAVGVGDLREKDVNLTIARSLKKALLSRGFEVIMTRERDLTLTLEERTAVAESSGGDVFISIHANASEQKRARGIEVYTLDANHERHSLDVAARENGVPAVDASIALQRALAQLQVGEVGVQHPPRLGRASSMTQVMRRVRERARDRSVPDLGRQEGPVSTCSSCPACRLS